MALLLARKTCQSPSTQKKSSESEPGVLQSTCSIEHKALVYRQPQRQACQTTHWHPRFQPQRHLKPHRRFSHKGKLATKALQSQRLYRWFLSHHQPSHYSDKRWFQADHKPLQSGFKITTNFQMPLKSYIWFHILEFLGTYNDYYNNMLGSLFHKPH